MRNILQNVIGNFEEGNHLELVDPNFSKSRFENWIFDNTTFRKAEFQNYDFLNCRIQECQITKASFYTSLFKNCEFDKINLDWSCLINYE